MIPWLGWNKWEYELYLILHDYFEFGLSGTTKQWQCLPSQFSLRCNYSQVHYQDSLLHLEEHFFIISFLIFSPREAFHVVLPPLPSAPTSSIESNSSTGVHLLRAILGNEQFHKLISTRFGQLLWTDVHCTHIAQYRLSNVNDHNLLFLPRLPVSNIHVVLGCHRSPSTSTSNLKVNHPHTPPCPIHKYHSHQKNIALLLEIHFINF